MDLIVPVVLWNSPPLHPITSILVSRSGDRIFTGSTSGQICLWKVESENSTSKNTKNESEKSNSSRNSGEEDKDKDKSIKISPKSILVFSGSPISVLSRGWGGYDGSTELVLSITTNGDVSSWAVEDGQCQESRSGMITYALPPTSVTSFCQERYIAVSGSASPSIEIIDVGKFCVTHRVEAPGGAPVCAIAPLDAFNQDATSSTFNEDLYSKLKFKEKEKGVAFAATAFDSAFITLDADFRFDCWVWRSKRSKLESMAHTQMVLNRSVATAKSKLNIKRMLQGNTYRYNYSSPTRSRRHYGRQVKKKFDFQKEEEEKKIESEEITFFDSKPCHITISPDSTMIVVASPTGWACMRMSWLKTHITQPMLSHEEPNKSSYVGSFFSGSVSNRVFIWDSIGRIFLFNLPNLPSGESEVETRMTEKAKPKLLCIIPGDRTIFTSTFLNPKFHVETSASAEIETDQGSLYKCRYKSRRQAVVACYLSDKYQTVQLLQTFGTWEGDLNLYKISNLSMIKENDNENRIEIQKMTSAVVADSYYVKENDTTEEHLTECCSAVYNGVGHPDAILARGFKNGTVLVQPIPVTKMELVVKLPIKTGGISSLAFLGQEWEQRLMNEYSIEKMKKLGAPIVLAAGTTQGDVYFLRLFVHILDENGQPCAAYCSHNENDLFVCRSHFDTVSSFSFPPIVWRYNQLKLGKTSSQGRLFCSIGIDRAVILYHWELSKQISSDQNVQSDHILRRRNATSIGHSAELDISDNSLSPVKKRFEFRGHGGLIQSIEWKLELRILLVLCSDGFTYVWSIDSGSLERRISSVELFSKLELNGTVENLNAKLLQSPTSRRAQSPRSRSQSPTSRSSTTSNGLRNKVNNSCLVTSQAGWPWPWLDENLHEIGNTVQVVSVHYSSSDIFPASPMAQVLLLDMKRMAMILKMNAKKMVDENKPPTSISPKSTSATSSNSESKIDFSVFLKQPEFTYLLAWGVDKDLDQICTSELGMKAPNPFVSFALPANNSKSKSNAFTMLLPGSSHQKERWLYSHYLTGLHSMSLVSFFMTPMKVKFKQGLFSKLITHYGVLIPEMLARDKNYKEGSLALLAQFGLASWEEGHVAARLLIQCAVERMPRGVRLAKATEWAARLHRIPLSSRTMTSLVDSGQTRVVKGDKTEASSAKLSRNKEKMNFGGATSAAVSSGMSALGLTKSSVEENFGIRQKKASQLHTDRNLKTLNNKNTLHSTSSQISARYNRYASSVRSINGGHRKGSLNEYMPTDEEVIVLVLSVMGVAHPEDIGQITAKRLTRVLCSFLEHYSPIHAALAAEIIGKGFALWRPYIDNLSGLIQRLLYLTLEPGNAANGGSVVAAAQRALMEVGLRDPPEFVQTAGKEALRPDVGARHHCTALMALVALVNKHPAPLRRYLPAVVEAVICALDPSEPELRKGCLRASTRALHELVKRYPMVSFHQKTQRYAVGTTESVIIIYDLRTATKWRILNGHKSALSALAFISSGEMLASYASEECSVKAWKAGSSGMLGGILGIQGRCVCTVQLPALKNVTTSTSKILTTCKIKWISDSTILLTREDMSTYNIRVK